MRGILNTVRSNTYFCIFLTFLTCWNIYFWVYPKPGIPLWVNPIATICGGLALIIHIWIIFDLRKRDRDSVS